MGMTRPSYRHLILFLSCVGFMISFSLRSAFVMTVTHTSRLEEEPDQPFGEEQYFSREGVSKVYPDSISEWRSLRENYNSSWPEILKLKHSATRKSAESMFYSGCTVYNSSRDYNSEYGWSESVQFYSVYYLGMGPGYVTAGYILSKLSSHHVIAVGFYTTAVLHLLLPVVFTLSGPGVMVMRLLNGFVESAIQPAIIAITKSWAFQGEESMFLATTLVGTYLSPALSNFFVGACLCYISWNASLYILAGLLLVWGILWHLGSYNSPLECPHLSNTDLQRYRTEQNTGAKGNTSKGRKIPWRKILTSKPVWAIWVATANKNCNLAAVSSLVPLFFKEVYGIQAADSGLLLIAPFVSNSATLLLSSYISDRLIRSGKLSTTAARKMMQCTGALGEAVFLICVIYVPDWRLAAVCLTLAQAMTGLCFPGFGCNTMDLSKHYAGAISGVCMTGVLMVFAITGIASLLPDGSQKWITIFWINAGIAAFSCIFYLIFASGEVQPWGVEEGYEENGELKSLVSASNGHKKQTANTDYQTENLHEIEKSSR
ncbi:vesicular glutamate transporter [Elysia marginata]|uniref:Vesicular glutamate transporter n=1 Tax=Elysia marginata TaxID=1093978 RepID=A0AAV4I5U8_9GAST|nr:vesicular glutamate transporter [Elysia marginata]